MTYSNPYQALPSYTRWSKAIGGLSATDVDPAADGFPFHIKAEDKVATGGSCFAQHIARHLSSKGFNYFVVEPGHQIISLNPSLKTTYNYGTYSARYGNIYTSRQLLQLIKRAYGTFTPVESVWTDKNGRILDPFRPEIQPNGFSSLKELEFDRKAHLEAVRTMFEELDVFVFTLGLTEYWYSRADQAALPMCPGVSGGIYDEAKYGFANLTVDDVVRDMQEFIEILRSVNRKAKIVLTVSPVPLAATAENRHVLVSTTYSKSVLRVAAEIIKNQNQLVGYFPSYEIITGNFNRGGYYADNLRDVVESGVSHVMRLFLQHATVQRGDASIPVANDTKPAGDFYKNMDRVIQTVCEEALIEASLEENSG